MVEHMDEREARREYIRHRQRIVFAIAGAVMAVVLVFATLVYTKVIDLQPDTVKTVQPNYGVKAPCAAKNQDGTPMKWPANDTTKVRVLNGTEFMGLGNAVYEELQNRHFTMAELQAGNYTSNKVDRTMIVFGEQAINNAYALARNFSDAELVMDDRPDRLVDVVIGNTFNNLRSDKEMKKDGDAIKDIEGCLSVDQMKKQGLPKAPEHALID